MTVALALAHSAKQQPFNADFYVAAATVIPVLFLAIAVQSSLYQDLVKLFIRASNRPPSPVLFFVGQAPLGLALLVLLYGITGEIAAMSALAKRGAGLSGTAWVVSAVFSLTIIAGIGPASTLLRALSAAHGKAGPEPPETSPQRAARSQVITTRPRPLPKWAKRTPSLKRKQRNRHGR